MALKNLGMTVAAASLIAAAYTPAHAVSLNFAGLDGNSPYEHVDGYYAGGFGSEGSGPGPNYGITFSSNAIVGGPFPATNGSNIPGGPGAQLLFFLSGSSDIMDVAGGFTTGFSFDYSSPFYTGTVTVWSGTNGTGTLLATLNLGTTPEQGPGCPSIYCPFESIGVTFPGTALSVDFAGTENQIAFANITTNSSTPGGVVPEASTWAMMALGFAGLGFLGYRKTRRDNALA